MDFFTVPTITFGVLYCFFVIGHDRRRALHLNVTSHPTSSRIVQQLREAFPYQFAPKFLTFDHDAKYGLEVPAAIRSMSIYLPPNVRTKPLAKRCCGTLGTSCRRDSLDHIIVLNERHLRRLMAQYVSYYHHDRTHLRLYQETPSRRIRLAATGQVISHARLGGLHHRYNCAA